MPTSAMYQPTQLSIEWPVLLLPLHLETRRIDDDLCIRVFPDQPFVDSHQEALGKDEFDAGSRLFDILGQANWQSNPDARGEWRELARRYGINRAAWIIRSVDNHRTTPPRYAETANDKIPTLFLLPDCFDFFVYKDGVVAYHETGARTSTDSNLLPERTNSADSDGWGLYDAKSKWVYDFQSAIDIGLGIRIPLHAEDRAAANLTFSEIMVVGLLDGGPRSGVDAFTKLLNSHRHTDGVEFLEYGTPTNNTGETLSGHSPVDDDLLSSFHYEVESPLSRVPASRLADTAAAELASALGLDQILLSQISSQPLKNGPPLDRIKGADSTEHHAFRDIGPAVWPATGDYFLSAMLGFEKSSLERELLFRHVDDYLRPSGPLPSLRIGNLPYGFLPVTRTKPRSDEDPWGWQASALDHHATNSRDLNAQLKFDDVFYKAIRGLAREWLNAAKTRVPRVGTSDDTDAEILKIVAMSPHSLDYRVRPIVDQTLIAFFFHLFRSKLFGASSSFGPYGGSAAAEAAWLAARNEVGLGTFALLKAMGADDAVGHSLLMRAFEWGNSRPLNMQFVRNEQQPSDSPETYIPALLRQDATVQSGTLLFDLLKRSLAGSVPASMASKVSAKLAALPHPVFGFFNETIFASAIHDFLLKSPKNKSIPDDDALLKLAMTINTKRGALGRGFATVEEIRSGLDDSDTTIVNNLIDALSEDYSNRLTHGLRDLIDGISFRLDATFGSFATRRLKMMRDRKPKDIYWGAYGYVENLNVPRNAAPMNVGGFVHAPSVGQAGAATLLRNAFESHHQDSGGNAFTIDLTSDRVHRALNVIEGVQQGVELGVIIGGQVENALHRVGLDRLIDEIREAFPITAPDEPEFATTPAETVAARNVCDGRALAEEYRSDPNFSSHADLSTAISMLGDRSPLDRILAAAADTGDAVGDLLMFEGVYQAAQGNYERAGAALDACAGIAHPPDIHSVRTPIGGINQRHRLCVYLPCSFTENLTDTNPRRRVEPRLNAWVDSLMNPFDRWRCLTSYIADQGSGSMVVTLGDLKLSPLDFVYLCSSLPDGKGDTEIEVRIRQLVRSKNEVPAAASIEIDFAPVGAQTMADAMEFGRAILDILGNSAPLESSSLAHADDQLSPNYTANQLDELDSRARTALSMLAAQAGIVDPELSLTDTSLKSSLNLCADFGIQEALFETFADPFIATRRQRVFEIVNARVDAATRLLETSSAKSGEDKYTLLLDALKALFGESFVATISFPVPNDKNPGEFQKALDHSPLPPNLGDDRIWLWLQQLAETHPRIRSLETLLLLAEAWGTRANNQQISKWRLVQLPHDGSLYWQALSNEELPAPKRRVRGCQSIVAIGPEALDLTCMSGLMIDEWTEELPNNKVQTAIGLEADQPSSQAIHAWLVAVPGNFEHGRFWTTDHLAEIVRDTIELAKIRLVDLDALPDVAGIFPALMFPISRTVPTPQILTPLNPNIIPDVVGDGFPSGPTAIAE